MKPFLKNCFQALLCLYRSHPSYHKSKNPFRGQGVKSAPKVLNLHALAYIGTHYPCHLKALNRLVSFYYEVISASQIVHSKSNFRPLTSYRLHLTSYFQPSLSFLASRISSLYIRHRSSFIKPLTFYLPSLTSSFVIRTSSFLLLLALILPAKVAYTQTPATPVGAILPLEVGDPFPYPTLVDAMNHDNESMDLSDHKGKLLILDFWATWCAPCIAGFPKVVQLNDKYKGEATILPVTYQERSEVERLFNRSQKLKGLTVPMLVSDNTLRHYFPHTGLPHHIWIDRDGLVMAITYENQLNEENIENALAGKESELDHKKDVRVAFEPNEPLIAGHTHIAEKPILYQSALTGYIPGVSGKFETIRHENSKIKKFLFTNVALKTIFSIAFGEGKEFFTDNRIMTDVKEPEKLITSKMGEELQAWIKEGNLYCYELIFPDMPEDRKWKMLRSEIEKLFPQYLVEVSPIEKPVWALRSTGDATELKSKGGAPSAEFTGFSASMQNTRIAHLVAQLNVKFLQKDHRSVVDMTGIDFPVDLYLEANLSDVSDLNAALQKHGLVLVEEQTPVRTLVIKDNPNPYTL